MHFPDIAPCAHELDPNLGPLVDDLVAVIRKLWGVRCGVEFDFPRNKLNSEKRRRKIEQRYLHD